MPHDIPSVGKKTTGALAGADGRTEPLDGTVDQSDMELARSALSAVALSPPQPTRSISPTRVPLSPAILELSERFKRSGNHLEIPEVPMAHSWLQLSRSDTHSERHAQELVALALRLQRWPSEGIAVAQLFVLTSAVLEDSALAAEIFRSVGINV